MAQSLASVSKNSPASVMCDLIASRKLEYDPKSWLTDKQNQAYASGDAEAIRQADEEALNEAFAQSKASFIESRASLVYDTISDFAAEGGLAILDTKELTRLQDSSDSAKTDSVPANKSVKKTEKERDEAAKENFIQLREKMREMNGELKNWFAAKGCQVVRNSGRSNNCAIISLLQLATGELSEHADKARELKKWLVENYPVEVPSISEPVYANTTAMENLIEKVNREYCVDMKVTFVMADQDGHPVMTSTVGDGKNNVVIFDQGGHFESVMPVLP